MKNGGITEFTILLYLSEEVDGGEDCEKDERVF